MLPSIEHRLAAEIAAKPAQIAAAIGLLDEGATVPFISRYRKETTGGLDDTQLRLLEEKGLIRAEYQANPDQHGPGRSAVLFFPTQEANRLINELAGNPADIEDWQDVKEQILQQLRHGKAGGNSV